MEYGETLKEYVEIIADKLRKGTITQDRFYYIAGKLVAWEIEAIRKGLM